MKRLIIAVGLAVLVFAAAGAQSQTSGETRTGTMEQELLDLDAGLDGCRGQGRHGFP